MTKAERDLLLFIAPAMARDDETPAMTVANDIMSIRQTGTWQDFHDIAAAAVDRAVAAERERWFRVTEAATTAAIVETREACAKIVEKMSGADAVYPEGIRMIADAIRARSD